MRLMPTEDISRALERTPSLRDTSTHRISASTPAPAATPRPSVRTDDRVQRYAPLLHFAPSETHFPIDPEAFIARARLRRYGWSDDVRDGIWHPRRGCWEARLDELPPSADTLGVDVAEACRLIQFEARALRSDGRNRRPCDANNLWYGRRAGYALELGEPLAAELRGRPGMAPSLLYDRYSVPNHAGVCDVISYWFFYGLNPHAIAHEGDWESVSVIIPEGNDQPRVRYASHRSGVTYQYGTLELAEFTHPIVYVEPGSHGMFRRAEELDGGPGESGIELATWELEPRRIPTLGWSSFDGAWGRVGAGPRTTGPLGPLFRREDATTVQLSDLQV